MNATGRINNLVDPSTAQDAATKAYVDTKFTTVPTPTNTNDAANKGYVDTATTNMATTSSVSTAITTALGSSGTQTNNPTVSSSAAANNVEYRVLFSSVADGRASLYTDGGFTYNPSFDRISATTFTGTAGYANLLYPPTGSASGIVTNDSYRMYVTKDGYIGIGTTSPAYPVDIQVTTVAATTSVSAWWFGSGASSLTSNNVIGAPIAMKLNGSVWIDRSVQYTGFWATSDRRVKKNINYNISSECLNLFRQLKCSNYSYIDEREHNTNVYGYIAQDVSTVIPYAVTTQTGFIPSLYSFGKITKENGFIKITCSEQKTYTFHSLHNKDGTAYVNDKNEPASDKDGGCHFKVKLFDINMNEYVVRINEIIDNGIFTIENDEVSVKLTDEDYFVFGQEVDDYKILNNEAITVVATAALQEVDRQQQSDKVRIAELETHVSNLEATVAQQQSLINDILERLKTLEKV